MLLNFVKGGGSSWVEIFLGGNFRGGNCPGGSYPGLEFSLMGVFRVRNVWWESSRWQFSGWEFSCYAFLSYCTVNRPRNGYEIVGNIRAVSTDSFKQLEVASIIDYVTN